MSELSANTIEGTLTSGATLSATVNTLIVPTKVSELENDSGYALETDVQSALSKKQDTLVSGTNIKTVNGQTVLGSGDIEVTGGLEQDPNDSTGGIVTTGIGTLAQIDKTLTLDSYAADAKTVGDRFESNQSDISELQDTMGVTTKDATGTILGDKRTINVNNGNEAITVNGVCTDYIYVKNFDVMYTGSVFNYIGIAGYDDSKNYVCSILDSKESQSKQTYENYLLTIPDDVYYIRASDFASTLTNTILKISITDKAGYISQIVKTNYVYVSPSGSDTNGDGSISKPYASIFHANETITGNNYYNRFVISVADGFYTDLQAKYSGTYSGEYEGVICKNYVSYIGNVKNPQNCAISWNGATGFDSVTNEKIIDKCPFHIVCDYKNQGNLHTEVAGFTIVGRNLRYAMHVDTSGYGRDVDWIIRDCVFTWSGRPDSTDNTEDVPAIGTGSGKFEKGHLLRCRIQNASGLSNGFVNHDMKDRYESAFTSFGEGADITIESCNFNGGNGKTSIWMRNLYENDGVTAYDRLHVINCTGINEMKYTLGTGATMKWRAETKCSDVENNHFAENGYTF